MNTHRIFLSTLTPDERVTHFAHDIDEARFGQIRDAREALLDRFRTEEVYDVLLLNFADLERTMLATVVDVQLWYPRHRWEHDQIRRNIDRLVSNLLSSGKLLIDHMKRVVRASFGQQSLEFKVFEKSVEAQKAKFVGYRAMELLRNHAQHYNLPIQGYTFDFRTDEERDKKQRGFKVWIDPKELEKDRKVTAHGRETIKDLEALGQDKNGHVPLLPLVLEYVEGLSIIHAEVRKLYAPSEKVWWETVQAAVDEMGAPGRQISISIQARNATGEFLENIALDIELEERLGYLRKRNHKLVNLHKREISTS